MTAKIHQLRTKDILPSRALHNAIQSAFQTGLVLTWLFLFTRGAQLIFLTVLELGPKVFEFWEHLKGFLS